MPTLPDKVEALSKELLGSFLAHGFIKWVLPQMYEEVKQHNAGQASQGDAFYTYSIVMATVIDALARSTMNDTARKRPPEFEDVIKERIAEIEDGKGEILHMSQLGFERVQGRV